MNYPLFDFAPNWHEPYAETLAWLTNLLRARDGTEQRFSLRDIPRTTLEYTAVANGNDSARLDQYLGSGPAQPFLLPLWHERVRTRQAAPAGARRVEVPTAQRQFAIGCNAALLGSGKSEAVLIASMDDDGLDLAAPLANAWPAGTRLAPAYPARLEAQQPFARHTPQLASARLRFALENVPAVLAADWEQTHRGVPVWTPGINWASEMGLEATRYTDVLDFDTGIISVTDPCGRAFFRREFTRVLRDFDTLRHFRLWLGARQGRLNPMYMPTYEALSLQQDLAAGDTAISIDAINLPGALNDSGRSDIAIRKLGGEWLFAHVANISRNGAVTTLHLDAPLGVDLPRSRIRLATWAALVRLESDAVELTHHTDTLAETRLAVREIIQ
jgi:hypothetical protein